jgi:hypothetical protein
MTFKFVLGNVDLGVLIPVSTACRRTDTGDRKKEEEPYPAVGDTLSRQKRKKAKKLV